MYDHRNDSDARTMSFELYYFGRFGRLANPGRQAAYEKALQNVKNDKNSQKELASLITDGAANLPEDVKDRLFEKIENGIKRIDIKAQGIKIGGKYLISTTAMSYAANYAVAASVVNGTVSQGISYGGRRAAVFAIEQTSHMAMAQGGHAALNGLKLAGKAGTFLPGLSAAVGELIGDAIANYSGITNYHTKNCLGAGGSIAGGAAAGACVGGPVGAGAGAVLGAVSWGVGKIISGLANTKLGIKGPNDNWCFVQTGSINGKYCIGTYCPGDSMYWCTYWKEYKRSYCSEYVMSAGQAKNSSFQVCVWNSKNKVIKHINHVFYRDFIWVHEGWVIHCKGEHHGRDAGKVEMYQC